MLGHKQIKSKDNYDRYFENRLMLKIKISLFNKIHNKFILK